MDKVNLYQYFINLENKVSKTLDNDI